MVKNKYGLAYVDLSFILTRNLWVATKDKEIHEMSAGEILRITLQSLRKLSRDWGITADKIIMISDTWDKNLGGYIRTHMVKDFVAYKGSRKYMTEQLLEDMRMDPNTTPEEIKAAERELAINKVKYEAKRAMLNGFPEIGIYSYGYPGYEFDDIATLASFMRAGKINKPDIIITKDTDLLYSLSPTCSFFSLPTRGSEPKVTTYDEMYATIPQELRDKGVSLYNYHAFMDSLGFTGHNDMASSKKSKSNPVETILKIMAGDYSDVENIELFKAQMSTFNLGNFPNLDKVQNAINTEFETKGKLGSLDDFHFFCSKYGVQGISDRYYSEFADEFDPRLFTS